ncbi:MAG: BatD family protein [Gammaproteobacteria bacterium]|nr:BatD family protein [Gammaproteobacteria bacterium]
MIPHFVRIVSLLVAILCAVDVAWAADVNAWLDRTRISAGETAQLTLEAEGQVSGRPDTAPLETDFEVLGMSTGSRVNIVNGRTDARTTWTLTLSPKRSGRLTIPALRIGGSRSTALTLEVSDVPAPAPDSGADILIETELAPREPYVQAQLLYTVRLLSAVPISGGQLSDPKPENTLVQRLGEDREYALMRNGRRYQVIERRYALFPQTSGPLELAAPVFDGEIPDSSRRRTSPFKRFFGNDPFFGSDPFDDLMTPTRRVRVRGEPAELDIRPRPDAAQGAHWLPAERLLLNGAWQPDTEAIQVGEPVTLVLEIEARGLTGGQLPNPLPANVDGFNVYPDQAQRQTDSGDSGVTGHLQQKIAFIPERSGELALPAIEVHWWDTQANQERIASLPGRMLHVTPAAGQATQDTSARVTMQPAGDDNVSDHAVADISMPEPSQALLKSPRTSSPGPWPWISAALAIGWLVTLVFWWVRSRGIRHAVPGEKSTASKAMEANVARKQFLAACQANDATTARRMLLAWAAAHWPTDPPQGLEALAQRLHDPVAGEALAELNRALYKEDGTWNGVSLSKCLQQLPQQDSGKPTARDVLAPLYPHLTYLPKG